MKEIMEKARPDAIKKTLVVLWTLTKKSVKNQYRRSMLGILWTVLNPLLNMLVMSFVFSQIFGRSGIGMDYSVYVLSGNIVFSLMRMSTVTSMPCLVNNYDLITKTRISYWILPFANVFTALVNFGFSMVALIGVMLVRMTAGVRFYWTMFMILVPWLPSILLFSAGLSFLLSVVYVRFRDLKHIYNVFLTLWMYMTPIFYSLTSLQLSGKYGKIMKLNPMYHYVDYFRQVLIGQLPDWKTTLICYGCGLGMFAIGCLMFKLMRKKLILYM